MSGTIKDESSGETLPYTSVYIDGKNGGVTSNQYGFYSLSVPAGNQVIVFSFVGYITKKVSVNLKSDTLQNVELSPNLQEIEEVVVSANKIDVIGNRMSKIDIKTIKELPNLLGESDLLRSLQVLSGVSTVTEVGRGFNVRGGGVDQNLLILDEAIIYNSSHLFGSYSVFNPDIIKNAKFYKSEIPAKYGGRISSVIDVTQKEGNMKSFHVSGGLGLISSRLTLEGPIVKDKTSFIVSARKSYVDMFFKYTSDDALIHDTKAGFYDINAKLNYIINDKNRIYISGYQGNDNFKIDQYNQEYGNLTTTLRYNHIFNNNLFLNSTLIYSDYNMIDGESISPWAWKNRVGLQHYEFNNSFIFTMNKNQVEFGIGSLYYNFFPGELDASEEVSTKIKIPTQHALESSVFINDVISLNSIIEIQLGLRYSLFNYLGKEDIYYYEKGIIRDISTIYDTVPFSKNEIIQTYHYPEPRVGAVFNINNNNSVKVSYNRMAQYVHLVSNTVAPTPYDMWKPSNNNIKPLKGDQVSLGYFTNILNNSLEISVESFYKIVDNTLQLKPGADIGLNRTLDADLIECSDRAYGIEILLNKTKGKNSGSISYTYTKSERKANNLYSSENILPKDYFPSNNDIPNKLTIVYKYKIGPRSSFSSNFIYMTGRPITYPSGQYIFFYTLTPFYPTINQHRLPDYHRLDVALTVEGKQKPNKKWNSSWNFSLYNVYGHKNPYTIYIQKKDNSKDTEAVRLSIFGSIIPSITYSFNF